MRSRSWTNWSVIALPIASCVPKTATWAPRVPDCATSCRALARSGAVHLPSAPGLLRERAVRLVAGEVGRQHLARRLRQRRAAEDLHVGAAVDAVAHRLARLQVVERRHLHVERHVVDRGQRVHVRLRAVRRPDLVQAVGRGRVGHPVGLAVLDLGDLVLDREPELELDLIRRAGRLRGLRPYVEVRVSHHHRALVRLVGLPHVRPGPGDRGVAHVVQRCVPGNRERERQGELVEELRIGRGQMERHGARRVVRHHALRQIAAPCRPGALRAADDALVEAVGRPGHGELALDDGDEVARLHQGAVGVMDPGPDMERVGLAAVGRRRHGRRQVGHDHGARDPGGTFESHQAVVHVLRRLEPEHRVVLRGVERAPARRGEHDQRSAQVRPADRPGARRRRAATAAREQCRNGTHHGDTRNPPHGTSPRMVVRESPF